MVRKLTRTAPLLTLAAAPKELSDAELIRIVAGNGKPAAKGEFPKEQVTFEFGALTLQY